MPESRNRSLSRHFALRAMFMTGGKSGHQACPGNWPARPLLHRMVRPKFAVELQDARGVVEQATLLAVELASAEIAGAVVDASITSFFQRGSISVRLGCLHSETASMNKRFHNLPSPLPWTIAPLRSSGRPEDPGANARLYGSI